MPERLMYASAATPAAFVAAVPLFAPLSVKTTDLPLTTVPPDVSVAAKLVTPPNVPIAGLTARLVGGCPNSQFVLLPDCTLELQAWIGKAFELKESLTSTNATSRSPWAFIVHCVPVPPLRKDKRCPDVPRKARVPVIVCVPALSNVRIRAVVTSFDIFLNVVEPVMVWFPPINVTVPVPPENEPPVFVQLPATSIFLTPATNMPLLSVRLPATVMPPPRVAVPAPVSIMRLPRAAVGISVVGVIVLAGFLNVMVLPLPMLRVPVI